MEDKMKESVRDERIPDDVVKRHPPSAVHRWKPKKEDLLVDYDGRVCYIHFERVFNPQTKELNQFSIIKDAFKNQLDLICLYINYFIYKYDYEREFMTAYLNLKYSITVKDAPIYFGEDTPDPLDAERQMTQFIKYIYDILFTPTIVAKVNQMVEDNYLDDIERDDGRKYASKEKKHLESLEFTNEQVKIMLAISMGMKMMCPIMFQYMAQKKIKPEKKSSVLFKFFFPLFLIFTPKNVDVYNKIFVFVKKKVMESKSLNELIFKMREVLGVDEYTIIALFVQNVIISDNFVKFMFSNVWNKTTNKYSENIPGFLKTVIKVQFFYYLKIQHAKTFTELTHTRNADNLSGIDKLEMSSNKIDAGRIIIEEACAEDALERVRAERGYDISKEEIAYYREHWTMDPLQQMLIYSYFAPMVGSMRACYQFSREECIELAITLRNRLLMNSGFDNPHEFTDKEVFPYILLANVEGKVNTRVIRNAQFSEDCENSYIIQDLINVKYKLLEEIDPMSIMMLLSKLNNTIFTYCVYEAQDMLGVPIDMDRANVTDAAGYFLRML